MGAQFWSDRMCCRNTLSFINIVDLHFMPENDHYFTVSKTNRVKSPEIKRLDSIKSVLFQSMVFCFFLFLFCFCLFLVFFFFLKKPFFLKKKKKKKKKKK